MEMSVGRVWIHPVEALRPTPLDDSASFVSWLGENFNSDIVFGDFKQKQQQSGAIQVSEKPRAYVWPNFLTEEEAAHILEVAAPQMRRSTVVGDQGAGVVDNIRTSYGTFIKRLHDPVIAGIEKKIAQWTNTSIVQQEDIQVLRYVDGQKYGAHQDGLNRMATVVMFLADTDEGGETIFPNSEWLDPALADGFRDVSVCARGHVGLRPRRGTALLFYDKLPDGSVDAHAMHTACPVLKGIKWSAPVWLHAEPFRPEELQKRLHQQPAEDPDPGFCEDLHPRCPAWASAGECTSNAGYMAGNDFAVGACRAACAACEPCQSTGRACYARNRERAGYLDLFDEVRALNGGVPSPEL